MNSHALTTAVTVALSVLAAVPAHAEADESSRKGSKIGGGVVTMSEVDNETGVLVGGYGATFVSSRFAIGIAGFALASSTSLPAEAGPADENLQFSYGGVYIAHVHPVIGALELSETLLLGGGGVDFHDDAPGIVRSDELFVLEPGVTLHLRAASSLRIDAGASWRFAAGVDVPGLSDDDLSGLAARAGVTFGKF